MKTADFSWNLTEPETIRLNRQGQLSERQRELLYRHTPWPVAAGLIYLFLLGLVTVPFWWPFEERLPSFVLPLYIVIFGFGALLTISYGFFYGWRAVVDRQDVRQGKIVGGYGEVTKSGQGYVAQVQGVKLRTLLRKVDLLPGRYYFYYLPRSRFLLSAEAQAVDAASGSAELQQHLGQRFKFDEQTLVLNRTGQVSGRQRVRLLGEAAVYGVFLVGLVSLTPFMIYNALRSETFELFSFQSACLAFLLFGGIGWLAWMFLPRLVDAAQGKSLAAVGPVQLHYEGSGRSYQLYYLINDLKLPVAAKDYYTVVEGVTYKVHYTRWARKILSIEPVDEQHLEREWTNIHEKGL